MPVTVDVKLRDPADNFLCGPRRTFRPTAEFSCLGLVPSSCFLIGRPARLGQSNALGQLPPAKPAGQPGRGSLSRWGLHGFRLAAQGWIYLLLPLFTHNKARSPSSPLAASLPVLWSKTGCDAWDTNLYFSRHEYRLHNYYISTRGG